MDQVATAKQLLAEIDADGHTMDLDFTDLLDFMAIMGIEFAEGTAASTAYFKELQHGD